MLKVASETDGEEPPVKRLRTSSPQPRKRKAADITDGSASLESEMDEVTGSSLHTLVEQGSSSDAVSDDDTSTQMSEMTDEDSAFKTARAARAARKAQDAEAAQARDLQHHSDPGVLLSPMPFVAIILVLQVATCLLVFMVGTLVEILSIGTTTGLFASSLALIEMMAQMIALPLVPLRYLRERLEQRRQLKQQALPPLTVTLVPRNSSDSPSGPSHQIVDGVRYRTIGSSPSNASSQPLEPRFPTGLGQCSSGVPTYCERVFCCHRCGMASDVIEWVIESNSDQYYCWFCGTRLDLGTATKSDKPRVKMPAKYETMVVHPYRGPYPFDYFVQPRQRSWSA